MQNDLEKAISKLEGHTIFLVKGDSELSSTKRGIAPMLSFIDDGYNLEGWSVADRTVGKAASMLFVKTKVKAVYAYVMTKTAFDILSHNNIDVHCEKLTDVILNRSETDLCPMEKAVKDINEGEIEKAYKVIKETYAKLQNK